MVLKARDLLIMTAVAAVGPLACGDDEDPPPADVEGDYSVNLTNGENTCPIEWTEGETTTGVPVTLTQNGSDVTGEITGVAGAVVDAILGQGEFEGSVSGSAISLVREGTNELPAGACRFRIRAVLSATLSGDTLSGTLLYTPVTDGDSECAAIETCSATAQMNGARAPQ